MGGESVDKLEVLNSIKVVDCSASCGELEYVLIDDTDENREKLRSIGVPQQEIEDASDGSTIDIAAFGFVYAGARWYEARLGGFLGYVPEHAPDWVKRTELRG